MVSLYDPNEASRVPALVDDIKAGATVLLVSDAGMPLISDPGYRLVSACVEAGLPVQLPARAVGGDDGAGGVRPAVGEVLLRGLRAAQALGADVAGSRRWPPSHARACSSSHRGGWPTRLKDAVDALGPDRRAVVCRELTKTHEEIVRGTLAELADWAGDGVLGEITVVLPARRRRPTCRRSWPRCRRWSSGGMRVKDACAQVVARESGRPVAPRALRCGSALTRLTGGGRGMPERSCSSTAALTLRLLGSHSGRNPPTGTGFDCGRGRSAWPAGQAR